MQDLQEVKADVLVVGGGLAGCWAAIRARQGGGQVVLAGKGPVGWTGQSKFASGDAKCLLSGEDLREWVEEIVVGGDYLNDQRWIELVLTETYLFVQQMEAFGCHFEREDGGLRREYSRGAHILQAVLNAAQMKRAMRQAAAGLGVKVLDLVFVARLLAEGDRITGALGLHTREGQPYLFSSPSIILAAGGCTFRGLYYSYHFSTSDAYALAYRAGAQLMNFEFVGCNSCHRDFPTTGMSRPVAFGGVFRNALGETFMERYDPGVKTNAFADTSAAIRDKVLTEARAGKPVEDMYAYAQEGMLDTYLSPLLM